MKQDNYTVLRIPKHFKDMMMADLKRTHLFAAERVGFFSTTSTSAGSSFDIITVTGYNSVPDEDYIDDPSVGAKINSNAIRSVMQRIISTGHGAIHVHLHEHTGKPSPSFTDLDSLPNLAKSFLNANPKTACGYLIMSKDNFFCSLYQAGTSNIIPVAQMTVVGYPMEFYFPNKQSKFVNTEMFSRQTFLGANSYLLFKNVRIGIIGLGGGGSHIAQQLAHLGLTNFSLFDEDHIEVSNHNRLIGGWFTDILSKMKKVKVINRLIKKINPKAEVKLFQTRWQENPNELKQCDIIIGCVDSINERDQLEGTCRRFLMPLIDTGMDVHAIPNHGYGMSGQIILSMPGTSCMRCFDFINPDKLNQEVQLYGNAGGRPQVVWPNGVLASTAVGIVIDIITGWSKLKDRKTYISYDGVLGHLSDHPKGIYCPEKCSHYPLNETGNPIYKIL
jgi:molybdopterin/thiamine biosynthesis adenylyltransferase